MSGTRDPGQPGRLSAKHHRQRTGVSPDTMEDEKRSGQERWRRDACSSAQYADIRKSERKKKIERQHGEDREAECISYQYGSDNEHDDELCSIEEACQGFAERFGAAEDPGDETVKKEAFAGSLGAAEAPKDETVNNAAAMRQKPQTMRH